MNEDTQESTHGFTQAALEAAYQLGRKAVTLLPGPSGTQDGKTQDGKVVCKVVMAGKQELKGWLVIPASLISATDSLGGITRWDAGNGCSIYVIPDSAGYSVRQEMAEKRGMPSEWANATYPRKTERKVSKDGKRFLD